MKRLGIYWCNKNPKNSICEDTTNSGIEQVKETLTKLGKK